MMSPKSLSLINHLKHISGINYGHGSAVNNTKMAMNRTLNNFNRGITGNNSIDGAVKETTF